MTEDTEIRRLDEDTVARIAAGEVVERPASAVKELVENSLDADASRIEVAVDDGGVQRIRVADDGRGMTEADLRAAVGQHTTSKITDLADLETGVGTLGFRGEALHTIGSVSRMRIRSRPRADTLADNPGEGSTTADSPGGGSATGDSPGESSTTADSSSTAADTGTELVYEGGEVTAVGPIGCPEGTTVEVTDLFYNTPARRKFLKTTATEFAHVSRVVTRYALANPDVAISLAHDGREVFATTGQGDLQAAVLAVYGREVADAMIPVEAAGDDLPPGPIDAVSGLVSHPETTRSTREYLATYVNGRAVTADAVREGVMAAYGSQLGPGRYPFVVCFLEVSPDAVDVNVHPRKHEVRFDDAPGVRRQVESAVEDALLDHGLLRSGAPRGTSAPEETRVEPEGIERGSDDSGTADGSTTEAVDSIVDATTGDVTTSDAITTDATTTDATTTDVTTSDRAGDSSTEAASANRLDSREAGEAVGERDDRTADAADRSVSETGGDAGHTTNRSSGARTESPDDSSETDGSAADDASVEPLDGRFRIDQDRKFDAETDQRTLDGEIVTGALRFDRLPPLRVLGQLADTYLVCETPDGLALVDQHAADERVNFERLRAAVAEDPGAQALAEPVEVALTAVESATFEEYQPALERLGFRAEQVDGRTIAVSTVPAVLEKVLDPAQLRDVLAAVLDGDGVAGAETVDALADEFLGDLACHPSIKGNTSLHEGTVLDLLGALDDCHNPYACPHGRPVIVEIDESEIESRFERDYPGHGG